MIRITDPSLCCGCTACQAICPHDAISMSHDRLGFPYPDVDMDRCTDCGLCESVCAFCSDVKRHEPLSADLSLEVTAARHNDQEVLAGSQSGGAFTALSDLILEAGGVIYGAVTDKDCNVSHVRAESKEERDAMRGSKYVQSSLDGIFQMVRKDLTAGRKVMFTGTPCQVAGLRSYLPDNLRKELYLVDFICHGVPSPSVWKDYVRRMGRYGKIVKAEFRDKQAAGWKTHLESFTYEDGTRKTGESFRVLFYKNIMLRHSCATCPYDIISHKADVTLADFWGIDEAVPSMDGDSGVSMVICGSAKGQEMMDKASASLETVRVVLDYDFMSRRNHNLVRPTKFDKDRMNFEEEYARKGFAHVARKWGDLGLRYRLWKLKVYCRKIFDING